MKELLNKNTLADIPNVRELIESKEYHKVEKHLLIKKLYYEAFYKKFDELPEMIRLRNKGL